MKKIISILVALVLAMASFTAFAIEEEKVKLGEDIREGVSEFAFGSASSIKNDEGYIGGLYEAHIKFKAAAGDGFRFGAKFIEDTSANNNTIFDIYDRSDYWAFWDKEDLSGANIVLDNTTWNELIFRIDYRGDAINNEQPYSIIINGSVAKEGTHKLQSTAAINGFKRVRFDFYAGAATNSTEGTWKDFVLYRVYSDPVAESITAAYTDGTTAKYAGTALVSHGLDKLTFALDREIANTDGNVSFVDADGTAVEDTTVSVSGKAVTVDYSGSGSLPAGNYKLVIGKDVTINGTALGTNTEIEVKFSAPDAIFSPADGATVTGNSVEIKAYAGSADKVVVYVNDEKIQEFNAPSENGVYTCNYTHTETGTKYVDVYVYNGNEVSLISNTFIYNKTMQSKLVGNDIDNGTYNNTNDNITTNGVTTDEAVGNDGTKALKFTSSEYSGNNFVRLLYIYDTTDRNKRYVYRQMVTEFDMKVEEGTQAIIEIGANVNGEDASGVTPSFLGYGKNGKPMFIDENGYIAGSDTKVNFGSWMKVKHVLDFVNWKSQFYIDGNLVAEETIRDDQLTGYENTVVARYKYNVQFGPTATDGTGVIYIDNYKRYEPAVPPTVSVIAADSAAVENNIIAAGTNSVSVTLDKAYETLTAAEVSVTDENKTAINGAEVTISEDLKTIVVSGLSGVKAGSLINVTVAGTAKFAGEVINTPFSIQLYVGDANKVAVLPLKVETNSDNTKILAYSKYINGSGAPVDTYLIIAEYEDPETQYRVKQSKFVPIAMNANETGVISGYLDGITSLQGAKVMLWNTDFAPLVSDVEANTQ